MEKHDHEREMLTRLTHSVADGLVSVVVYGPAEHDDAYPALGGEHLLIVVNELDLETLRRLGDPVRWWLKKGEPWPRLFSSELLRSSADVYPIELLEISRHRRVLFGNDPIESVAIGRENLRVQCERELREKLMRLREGYVECHGHGGARGLHDLLAVSYASFVRIFRGCLYLVDAELPRRDHDVVTALCEWLDLSPAAFAAVEKIARGERGDHAEAAFAAYYGALMAAEARIDRLVIHPERRKSC